ncbi:MAG: glycosyltransferase family 4 protein [Spirulina sp.]
MDVIFVIFQTGSQANGGVESITQVIEHCRSLRPQIVTQMETVVNQRWRQAGAEVALWPLPYRLGASLWQGQFWAWGQRLWSLAQTNGRMFRRVRQSAVRVVHCNDPAAFWHTALGAKLAGAAVLFNIRDTKARDETYGWKWTIACWLSDALLVLSQEMRQSLMNALPAARRQEAKLHAIYSIVDTTALAPPTAVTRQQLRGQLGIPADAFAVGYVATLNPKKAQLALIEQAIPALHRAIPNLHLYLVGDCAPDNPYAQACVTAVQTLGLESVVTLTGYTPAVADWYPALDLVIVASRQEGLARCMIESLACGTPVVSFAVCSAGEILLGHHCGRVVPEGDYEALNRAIIDLSSQPSLREDLGKNGVDAVQHLFRAETIALQYEALYAALATRSPIHLPSAQAPDTEPLAPAIVSGMSTPNP